ncbi:MAG: hypothetical protein IT285_09870 [Bdellovibrionales bacterium]|nr:hypothetical protein [Bdellovibrionales bacterium]
MRIAALLTSTALALGLTHGPSARASVEQPHLIEQSVGFYFSRQGQQYFADNLESILFMNGYSFSTGVFPRWDYQADEAIDLDNLPPGMAQHQATLNSARRTLKNWLIGFHVNNPLFKVEVENIQYALVFDRFSIVPDHALLAESGERNAMVLVLEATVPELRIDVEAVKATDLANPLLKAFDHDRRRQAPYTAAMKNLALQVGPTGTPLTVRVPVLLTVKEGGGLATRVLDIETNIEDVRVSATFRQPLDLPLVRVSIGNMHTTLNQRALERQLLQKKDELLRALQSYLDGYAAEKLPDTLNEMIEARMPHGFFEMNRMDPPGSEGEIADRDKFVWGLSPAILNQTGRHLYLGLTGYVEDPRPRRLSWMPGWSWDPAPDRTVPSTRRPRVPDATLAANDGVLTLSQDLVNRMLQLSYNRGLNREFSVPGSNPIRLIERPRLVIDGSSDYGQAVLKLNVETEVDGLGSVLVNNPLRMRFDLRISLGRTATGGMKMRMNEIQLNSIVLDPSTINMWESKVLVEVRKKFRAFNHRIQNEEKLLVEDFRLPSSLFGMPMNLTEVSTDRNGFILLYVNLDENFF